MRVKLEFNVDLEEIPSEVESRLKKHKITSQEIEKSYSVILEKMKESNYLSACQEISSLTQKVSKLNDAIKDAYSILIGYESYKSRKFLEVSEKQEEKQDVQ